MLLMMFVLITNQLPTFSIVLLQYTDFRPSKNFLIYNRKYHQSKCLYGRCFVCYNHQHTFGSFQDNKNIRLATLFTLLIKILP